MAELPQKATLPDEYRHPDWTYSWQTTSGFSKRGNSLDDLNKAMSRHGFIRAFKELSADELVIDIDAHEEQGSGWESLKRLEAELGFTLAEYCTHVVDSPRSGRHFYFRKNPELVLPKKIKRFPGIDFLTSSPGKDPQLIGLPGSLHPESENRYQCVSGFGYLLTDCPDALIQLLTKKEPATTTTSASIPPSMANNATTRASKYVARMEPSISGSGGHNAAFEVACALVKGFALSIEQARAIFVSEYNPRCVPPWSDKEIEHKLKSAAESNRDAGYLLSNSMPAESKVDISRVVHQGERQSSGGELEEVSKALFDPIAITDLVRDFPDMRPAVIDGALRRGETANIIASAKMGKSFLAGGLAWCIATGTPWLSHEVQKGRVLIIDNELHRETLASRLDAIANAMMIAPADRKDAIDVLPLRGVGLDIEKLGARLAIEPGRYALVIMDALYRFIPKGVSENDNASMMTIYNRLDEYAKTWDCAIAVVHHTSKGQQGEKAVTDVGSGAGSIARAADLHLVIRPHEQDGLAVLDFECRSWKRHEPVSIRYEYPLWHAVAAEAVVRRAKSGGDAQQAKKDEEADSTIRGKIENRWLSVAQLRRETGMGPDRITRSLHRIGAKSRRTRSKSTGKKAERFSLSDTPIGGEVVRKVERQNLQATGQ